MNVVLKILGAMWLFLTIISMLAGMAFTAAVAFFIYAMLFGGA